jgi:hypothetical protein
MPVRAGVQNRDGFTTISEEAFIKYFANGVQHEKAEVLYAFVTGLTASAKSDHVAKLTRGAGGFWRWLGCVGSKG